MVEMIIVIAIVAAVAVLAGRSFYRTMTGKNDTCGGCPGTCHGCGCTDITFTQINGNKQED